MGRGRARRAGPRARLAQRRADRARRPGRAALRSSTPTGSRSSSRCPRPTSTHRRLAPDRRHEPRLARRHRLRHRTRRPRSAARPTASRPAPSSSWRRAGRTARRQRGGRMTDAERKRMENAGHPENGWREASPWYEWGPYLSERAWGGVREDYSRRRRRLELVPARPRPLARVPLERGRHGGHDRRLQPAVAGAGAVERPGPDPQGADVRAGRPRGQPRRGRQGVLVVPRRRPEQRLAALALPLPAGRVPVRGPGRDQPRRGPSSSPNTS